MKKLVNIKVLILCISILSISSIFLVSIVSADTMNVSINLQNNTPAYNGPVVGIGGQMDPWMYFYNQSIQNVNDDDFSNVMTKVRKTNVSYVRIWLQNEWWEPSNDNNDPAVMYDAGFTWNSPEMQSLYKYLDALKDMDVNVLIDVMCGDYRKMYPWMFWTNDVSAAPAPDKITEYAENIAAMVRNLCITKGYSNIKYISLCNEPANFYLQPIGYDKLAYYKDCFTQVYNRLSSEGLLSYIKMSGVETILFETSGEDWFRDFTLNMNSKLGAYTTHGQCSSGQLKDGSFASKIANWISMKNTNDSQGNTKPFLINEYECSDLTNTAIDGLSVGGLIAEGLRNGVAGFSRWRFYDDFYPAPIMANQTMTAGSSFGYGWINSKQDDYTPKFVYYTYSLLSKFIKKGSTTYTTTSNNNQVVPAIVKTADGKYTIIVVNWATETVNASFTLQNSINATFKKYQCGKSIALDTFGNVPSSSGSINVNGTTFSDSIPAETICVYTNIPDSTAPGQVTGLSASSSSYNKVSLTWTARTDSDLGYYRIYRSTASGFTPSVSNRVGEIWVKTGDTPTFNDKYNVEGGTTYYYKVSAVDTSENEGTTSAQASVTASQEYFSNTLTVTDDTVNRFYEITSSYDAGYKLRVSKDTGTMAYIEDAAGIGRNNIGQEKLSFPIIYKSGAGVFTDKISNGGAESGSGNPDSWGNWTNGQGVFTWDSSVYRSGGKSFKISNSDDSVCSCWSQNVSNLVALRNNEFSLWIKTSNVAKIGAAIGAYASIEFYDGSGNSLGERMTGPLQATHDWTYISLSSVTPANAVSATIRLKLWGTSGTVWFDDLKLLEGGETVIDGNTMTHLADSVVYHNIDANHKQIVTTRGAETLYYDFYTDRVDIKVTGSNPGGYYIEDGGYQPKLNGRVLWSDGVISNIASLIPGDSLQRNGTGAALQQFSSPYMIKYSFGTSKNITFTNGYRYRGYYQRFQVNSDEAYSMYFSRSNSIGNPGLESGSGTPSSWSTWTSESGTFIWDDANYHTGTKSGKIYNSSSANSTWYQTINNPESLKEVEFSGWVKTSSVSGIYGVFVSICAKDSGGNILGEIWSPAVIGTNDWKQLSARMIIPRNTAYLEVGGRLWGVTGTAWFDDFVFTPAHNGVDNPGSENGVNFPDTWSNWTSSGTPFIWDGSIYKTGSRSLKITQGTAQTSCWYQTLPSVQRCKEYEYNGWVKTSDVAGGYGAFISVTAKDFDGNIIQEIWSDTVTGTTDWTYVSGRIVLPPLCELVNINGNLWGSTGTAWFDDLSIKLVRK